MLSRLFVAESRAVKQGERGRFGTVPLRRNDRSATTHFCRVPSRSYGRARNSGSSDRPRAPKCRNSPRSTRRSIRTADPLRQNSGSHLRSAQKNRFDSTTGTEFVRQIKRGHFSTSLLRSLFHQAQVLQITKSSSSSSSSSGQPSGLYPSHSA